MTSPLRGGAVVAEWIRFDTSDLEARDDEGQRVWQSQDGDIVSLQCFDGPPDLPVPLTDYDALLSVVREQSVEHGVGVVELRVVQLDGCTGLRLIGRLVQDQNTGRGRFYWGKLLLPTRDLTLQIQVECPEHGMTGIRESMIIGMLMRDNNLRIKDQPEESGAKDERIPVIGPASIEGWVVDSSDPAPPHLARNISDDPKYDDLVPTHPLSRMRARLARLEPSIRVTGEFKALPPFDPRPRWKPWWKVW